MIDRLASRLSNLRKLGDRNRAQHPVSILRNDLVGQETNELDLVEASDPGDFSIEERTYALARRLFSPLLARAELVAETIRRDGGVP
jgi:hypothetical protein